MKTHKERITKTMMFLLYIIMSVKRQKQQLFSFSPITEHRRNVLTGGFSTGISRELHCLVCVLRNVPFSFTLLFYYTG